MDLAGAKASIPDFDDRVAKADSLKPVAEELGCSMAQLAVAWCLSNDKVSTVLIGASSTEQLKQNLKSLDVVAKMTPEIKAKIEAVVCS